MLYPTLPRIGLVIGTYEALPQVHLQLESWRRFCKDVPCRVHDDASPGGEEIRLLCNRYGAEYHSNATRMNHTVGDMLTYTEGLVWAKRMGVDLLVKFSRRWIPLIPWQQGLRDLAFLSQGHCFSNRCMSHGFGFRTECVAMHVNSWLEADACGPIREEIARGHSNLVEAVVHQAAGVAQRAVGKFSAEWEARVPALPGCGCYVPWSFMGETRTHPRAEVLWHEWAKAHEYHRALLQWGIGEYQPQALIDPHANIRNV